MTKLSVAIVGGGTGGLATAAALHRAGINVNVYEQASKFTRLGAGIQIGCNAMKVMRGLGLEPVMRASAFYPRSWNNREYDTGEVCFDMIFGESAEQKYGAPYLLGHRGDLHSALASAVPDQAIHLDHRVVGIDQRPDRSVKLVFANVERDGVEAAFRRFEATRKPRTSRVQLSSRTNTWLKTRTDPDWVYGYDAWNEPLAELEAA
jgi:6-hydroxynicotinate 3-monooxygenase